MDITVISWSAAFFFATSSRTAPSARITQAASVSVGGTVTAAGTLIAGDPDAHDTVSFTPFTAQAGLYGTLTLNADGTYAYTLNSGLSAVRQLSIGDTLQDVFLCQAQDQYGLTGSGTLTVTINGGNEAPTVAAATIRSP